MPHLVGALDEIERYLVGREFSPNLLVRFEKQAAVRYRNDVLVELSRGRHVLHVGCCDHVPLIRQKMAHGDWLHQQLNEVASSVLGVDISGTALDEAKKISGLVNMIEGDVASRSIVPEISAREFDIAIFGEVLEHIGNPVDFLRIFLRNYGRQTGCVVITVPNAFRGGNILNTFRNREAINSDHRFFFTPYTLLKVAVDAGLRPLSMETASFTRVTSRIKQSILNRWPLLAEDLILIAETD
jgi:hypothetical protein